MKFRIFFLLLLISALSYAQVGSININVFDDFTKKPLTASVRVLGSDREAVSGQGNVSVTGIPSGTYTFEISAEGFSPATLTDIDVVPNQNLTFSVGLIKSVNQIEEVTIVRKTYKTTAESPLSLRNITSEEVQKNAGSNRDVSKAILSFPGVGSTATFRNDLFIRGGSSAENKFYIDGIEVPVINHFQTQGASGGPRGIITVDFIKDVDFYSGAFPAKRNGVLS